MERQSLTCSNPRCKKDFTNPIIVQVVGSKNKAPYPACPYCLTEIAKEEALEVEEENSVQETKRALVKQAITQLKEVESTQPPSETRKCPHQLGYLKKRPKGEGIPEECMTCEKLLECM